MGRKHRKTFPCGHKGQGKECYRCEQEKAQLCRQLEQQAQQQATKAKWLASFEEDPIDLRGLPKKTVEKSRRIIAAIASGKDYTEFYGLRLQFDRTLIRIPVGRNYRMLCRDEQGQIVPLRVLSHEEYNAYASNRRQLSC